jgi:hypothetical protein
VVVRESVLKMPKHNMADERSGSWRLENQGTREVRKLMKEEEVVGGPRELESPLIYSSRGVQTNSRDLRSEQTSPNNVDLRVI